MLKSCFPANSISERGVRRNKIIKFSGCGFRGRKQIREIVGESFSRPFEESFFSGPKQAEGNFGIGGRENCLYLQRAATILAKVHVQRFFYILNITTNRSVADNAECGIRAVAHVEMDIGIISKEGFPLRPERKKGRLRDSIFLFKSTLEQQESSEGKFSVALFYITQGGPTLLRARLISSSWGCVFK